MTREEIIALAKQCGFRVATVIDINRLEAFFHAAQALEREACAKEAERMMWYPGGHAARAIRNRSN